jgi:hypothetical protein
MDPTSWANVSQSSLRAAPVTANPPPAATATTATPHPGRVAHRIACKSLAFPMIPAGRSVKLFTSFPRLQIWILPSEASDWATPLVPVDLASLLPGLVTRSGFHYSTPAEAWWIAGLPVGSLRVTLFRCCSALSSWFCWRCLELWRAPNREPFRHATCSLALLASLDLTDSSLGTANPTPGSQLTRTLALGSERLRTTVWPGRRLLRDKPQWQQRRVCLLGRILLEVQLLIYTIALSSLRPLPT